MIYPDAPVLLSEAAYVLADPPVSGRLGLVPGPNLATYLLEALGVATVFDPDETAEHNRCLKIDQWHYLHVWQGVDSKGYAKIVEVDPANNYEPTPLATPCVFSDETAKWMTMEIVDDSHAVLFWCGTDDEGLAQVLAINTTTWEVTLVGTPLSFEPANPFNGNQYNSCARIKQTTRYINFWVGADGKNYVRAFLVNPSTYEVTALATVTEFSVFGVNYYNSCAVVDDYHFINFWNTDGIGGTAQVFVVNETTWEVTPNPLGGDYNFDSGGALYNRCHRLSAEKFINTWAGSDEHGYAKVVDVDSTYTVTPASATGTDLDFDDYNINSNTTLIDELHVGLFWSGTQYGTACVLEIDPNSFIVTKKGQEIVFDAVDNEYNACALIDPTHLINFWSYGKVQTFLLS